MSEQRIDDNDYNRLRDKIDSILGNGNSNRGYGQVVKSFRAAEGALITSSQWNTLSEDLSNVVVHQTGSFPTLPIFNDTKLISLADYNQLSSLSDTLDSNRFSVGTGRTVISTKASKNITQPWTIRAQSILTVTFNTSNEARYFFNSGGKIRFSSSRFGGTNSPQNSAWTNLLNFVGNLDFSGQANNLIGYFDVTDNYQIWYQQNLSTPYSSNYFRIEVSSDVPVNVAGVAKILYFKITWEDIYPGSTDRVDGQLKLDVSEIKAAGPLKDSTNFNINSPLYNLTDISLIGTPEKFYNLTVSKFVANAVNDIFTVTLNTANVPDGEIVPYTISGILSSEINSAPLRGTFTVFNNTASQTFRTTSNDFVAIPVPVPVVVPVPPVPPPVRQARSIEFTTGNDVVSFWTVPNGVTSLTVTCIGGGAGGSSGSEADPYVTGGGGGGAGEYVKRTISVTPGQQLTYRVGRAGIGGSRTSGGNVRQGTAGGITNFHTVTARGGEPPTSAYNSHLHVGGKAGAGGIDGQNGQLIRSSSDSTGAALATGGQGGGIPGISTGGAGGQTPRVVDFSVSSRQFLGARAVTYPAWNSTMNQHAVWDQNLAAQNASLSLTIDFPFTGNYTFFFQTDNTGTLSLDGRTVLSVTDNFNRAPVSTTINVTSGIRTITVSGSNFGGYSSGNPAGLAALITGTGRTTPPNDGNGYNGSGYGAGGGGGFGQSGGTPPQGGGGNGVSGYIRVEWEE